MESHSFWKITAFGKSQLYVSFFFKIVYLKHLIISLTVSIVGHNAALGKKLEEQKGKLLEEKREEIKKKEAQIKCELLFHLFMSFYVFWLSFLMCVAFQNINYFLNAKCILPWPAGNIAEPLL